MIKLIRHRGLEEIFSVGKSKRVQPKHAKRLRLILSMLNVATHAGQMNAPGLRLHPLKGRWAGYHAVWVDENYRVTFKFEGQDATEVDYVDYH